MVTKRKRTKRNNWWNQVKDAAAGIAGFSAFAMAGQSVFGNEPEQYDSQTGGRKNSGRKNHTKSVVRRRRAK